MKKITVIILVLMPALALAQSSSPLDAQSYVRKGGFSLFDPSKLSMHQSYSLAYYSGGGASGSIGYYMNSLEYRFSNPLRIRVDIGWIHNPSGLFSGGSSNLQKGIFVPGFSIDWRPSESFNFRLAYRSVPFGDYRGYGLNPYLQEDER